MRRLLLFFPLLLLLAAGACATLPDIHPWTEEATRGRAIPTVIGARGELPPEKAKALLQRLAAQGKGSDLLARHIAIEEELAGAPLTAGNDVTLLHDGPATYRAMFDAIARAQDHVNLEFYIIEDDEVGRRFSDALIAKRREGVAVHLIYDSVGSLGTPRAFFERLRAAGVAVLEFNPVNPLKARRGWQVNQRDHRKMLIVDGRVAFTGGINISGVYSSAPSRGRGGSSASGGSGLGSGPSRDPRAAGWRDTNLRIAGPGAAALQQLFLATWQRQGGPPLPDRRWFPPLTPAGDQFVRILGSTPDDTLPAIYAAYVSAIRTAEKSVRLTMAYFVPDAQTMDVLTAAAQRGVEVTLVLPSYTDFWAVFHAGRSHYAMLLASGVRIYERQDALLHAKTAVIDGVWSTVGSSNLDWRSFLHNDEVNAVVLGPRFGDEMERMFARDVAASREITLAAWQARPLATRMKERAARVWEYWL